MKMVPKNVNKSSKGNKTNGNKEKIAASLDFDYKKDEDKSILRQPIDIGIRGVRDLIKALTGGTSELQDLLLNECSVIYECKICCNLFRSVANFISHKRVYCVKSFCHFTNSFTKLQDDNNQLQSVKQNNVTVIPDMPSQSDQLTDDPNEWVTSDKVCTEVIDCTKELQNASPRRKLDPVKFAKRRDITEIVAGLSRKGGREIVRTSEDFPNLPFSSDIAERVMMRRNARQKTVVELENVNDSGSSVFQTLKRHDHDQSVDSMKIQLIDLDRVVSKNQAVLQDDGKFKVTSQSEETEEEKLMEKHNCSLCDSSFLTEATLTRHVQIYHRERICYPCPLCRTFFASPSSVYRHLSKAHHRTEQQIRRLRPQVFSKAKKRKLLESSPKVLASLFDDSKRLKMEAEDWINNFEGALRCNGCGKLFNRRAVLNVHSATCQKRLALINANSQPTNKVKLIQHNSKSAVKQVLTHGNSKPVIGKNQLPKSGILVRRDYCKSPAKPIISSLLVESDRGGSWKPMISSDYPPSYQCRANSKSNSSDVVSTSSDSDSILLKFSTNKSIDKKRDSPNNFKLNETKTNSNVKTLETATVQDSSPKK